MVRGHSYDVFQVLSGLLCLTSLKMNVEKLD